MLILSGVFLSYVCFRMICAAAVSCVSSLSLSSLWSLFFVVVVACCCRVTAVCCRILLGIITKKNILEHLEELEQRAELPGMEDKNTQDTRHIVYE